MKRLALTVIATSILAACSSAPRDNYERRAYEDRRERQAQAERAVDQAPKWMSQLPRSNSAIYENGTATSTDMAMSVNKAKTVAFGKICMAAGGRVDQQSRVFITETTTSSTELSEVAIRGMCPGVDITGAEMVETKTIAEGGRFRAYVLMALPTGDANVLRRENEQRELRSQAQRREAEAFREIDANQTRPAR
jgi:hypothetical protein